MPQKINTQAGLLGLGWINGQTYGGGLSRSRVEWSNRGALETMVKQDGLFTYPVQNFGRFSKRAKYLCCACALALRDAGVKYSQSRKMPGWGLLHTNFDGCLSENYGYFADYIQAGRTLGRGNLFIYTLPTSPAAEAAIHFGLEGPALYYGFAAKPLPRLAKLGVGMVARREAPALLLSAGDDQQALCGLIKPGSPGKETTPETLFDFDGWPAELSAMIQHFSS